MKYLTALFCAALPFAAHADIRVKQELSPRYYAGSVMEVHLARAAGFIGAEARAMGCLRGDFESEITLAAHSRVFSSDTPGEVRMTWETVCENPDLVDVRFFIDDIGYDEDYTTVAVKFTTKSRGVIVKDTCVYGLDGMYRDCPNSDHDMGEWSANQE